MNNQAALKGGLAILGIVSLVFFAGCGGGTSQSLNNPPPPGSNPTPTITTISPNSAAAGGAAFTLTINGTNFVAASTVHFGGTVPTATFVSTTQLTAAIPTPAIASAGTVAVTVTNPTPGGGTSHAVNFTVASGGTTNPAWISLAVAPDSSGKFGKFAYLTNSSSNNVTIYSIDPATGSLTATGSITAGTSPQSVAVDHFGKFAYVANGGSNDISMYAINSTSGALETLGTVVAGKSPISVVIDPSGKFSYVANEGSNDISVFAITSTGTLDPLGPIAAGAVPTSVTVGPFGGFAYVTNANPNGPFEVNTSNGYISTYKVNSTGALEPSGTVTAGLYPRSIAVDPSGNFAYVANCGDFERNQGDIAMYTLDASAGALTLIGTVGAGSCPLSVALHPSGKFAYAANTGSDGGPDIEGVSMYTINPNGTLTPMGLINAGYCPSSLAVDPSGKFAYVTNHCDNTISMYRIDLTTGALTLIGTIGI